MKQFVLAGDALCSLECVWGGRVGKGGLAVQEGVHQGHSVDAMERVAPVNTGVSWSSVTWDDFTSGRTGWQFAGDAFAEHALLLQGLKKTPSWTASLPFLACLFRAYSCECSPSFAWIDCFNAALRVALCAFFPSLHRVLLLICTGLPSSAFITEFMDCT